MKVSIITCFLNTAQFLQEAIDSVLRQTYPHWELLLVDDGSTDGSSEIALENAARHPERILVITHENRQNKGLSASRNLAIQKASGPLVTFLDADDCFEPGYLENQVKLMEKEQVAMICEATNYWYSWNDPQKEDTVIQIGAPPNQTYHPPELMLQLYPLGQGAAPCVCGIVVKKEALVRHGGFNEAFTGMYEDQVFLSKFYLNEQVHISPACNNRYRQRPGSLMYTAGKNNAYFKVRGQYLQWLSAYITEKGINFPEVNNLLQKAMQPLPLVSVIMACYNEERFLGEAIQSVIDQDYDHWELLIIDDGSTNSSPEIAKSFAADYPDKIFYLEHENHQNKGVSASRNLGVTQAKGSLIAFIDADDVWLPQKLSSQVRYHLQYPEAALIMEASSYWYSWEDATRQDFIIPIGAPADELYQPMQLAYLLYPLGRGAAPPPSCLMMVKSSFLRLGGLEASFNKQFQLYEDQALLLKMYTQEKVYVSSECNNLYRQRTGSIVSWVKKSGQYHSVRRFFLEWLEAYLKKQNIQDKKLNALLNKAFLPYRHPNVYFLTHKLPAGAKWLTKKLTPAPIKQFVKSQIRRIKHG